MHVEIISGGSVLRQLHHNNQVYLEAPAAGEYEIRLTNTSPTRRLAVVSVDGVNVIDGKDAGYQGTGYVLGPWQSTTIKGFLRGPTECARFTFAEAGGSYAAQTGRGKKNTGVIGVAVFDEKAKLPVFVPPVVIREEHHHHHWPRPRYGFWYETIGSSGNTGHMGYTLSAEGADVQCSAGSVPCSATFSSNSVERDAKVVESVNGALDLGTAYGRAEAYFTQTTDFERATQTPALVLSLRYGVTAKLRAWGVPVDAPATSVSAVPDAFPASPGYAQPPAGWGR